MASSNISVRLDQISSPEAFKLSEDADEVRPSSGPQKIIVRQSGSNFEVLDGIDTVAGLLKWAKLTKSKLSQVSISVFTCSDDSDLDQAEAEKIYAGQEYGSSGDSGHEDGNGESENNSDGSVRSIDLDVDEGGDSETGSDSSDSPSSRMPKYRPSSTGKRNRLKDSAYIASKLQKRSNEVTQHEEGHAAAMRDVDPNAKPIYRKVQGPDGKRYAISGEVKTDLTPSANVKATERKASAVYQAATHDAKMSASDRKTAHDALQLKYQAKNEEAKGGGGNDNSGGTVSMKSDDRGWAAKLIHSVVGVSPSSADPENSSTPAANVKATERKASAGIDRSLSRTVTDPTPPTKEEKEAGIHAFLANPNSGLSLDEIMRFKAIQRKAEKNTEKNTTFGIRDSMPKAISNAKSIEESKKNNAVIQKNEGGGGFDVSSLMPGINGAIDAAMKANENQSQPQQPQDTLAPLKPKTAYEQWHEEWAKRNPKQAAYEKRTPEQNFAHFNPKVAANIGLTPRQRWEKYNPKAALYEAAHKEQGAGPLPKAKSTVVKSTPSKGIKSKTDGIKQPIKATKLTSGSKKFDPSFWRPRPDKEQSTPKFNSQASTGGNGADGDSGGGSNQMASMQSMIKDFSGGLISSNKEGLDSIVNEIRAMKDSSTSTVAVIEQIGMLIEKKFSQSQGSGTGSYVGFGIEIPPIDNSFADSSSSFIPAMPVPVFRPLPFANVG